MGLFFQMKSGYVPNSELRQMIRDTADILVYTIEEAAEWRPDLILNYYPSKYGFYWFVARVLALLEATQSKDA